MAESTGIEWTDSTWNIITGCSITSPGCRGCYAMKLAGTRLKHHPSRVGLTKPSAAGPVWTGEVRLNEQWLDLPQRWRRPRDIFVCAHGDLFHEAVPDAWIDQVFALMANTPWHRFQVLTKRSGRLRQYLSAARVQQRVDELGVELANQGRIKVLDDPQQWPLPNVILMVSAERQQEADERIPDLLATPAAARGVSLEPMLGPITLRPEWVTLQAPRLHWIICGGEAGPKARPMHPDWARSLRDQCAAAGVQFFMKQWGEWAPGSGFNLAPRAYVDHAGRTVYVEDGEDFPKGAQSSDRWSAVHRAGKKAAGRLLDGVEHNGVPEVSA